MSDITKKDLRELAEKATRGPWWIDSHGHRMSSDDGMQTVFIADDRMGPATRHPETQNLSHWPNDWDASFIASANPKTIIGLLDEIEALEAENAKLRAGLERRAVPDGCLIVPIQPTEEMRKRAQDYLAAEGMIVSDWLVHTVYTEMLAAAPSAPKADDPVKVQLLEALEAIAEFIPNTSASEGGAAKHSANVRAADKVRAAIAAARKGEV